MVEGPEPETTIPEFFEGHEVGTAQNSFFDRGRLMLQFCQKAQEQYFVCAPVRLCDA
ncbi:hypothetical protein KL86DES1_21307 [uncultured Desulfovibrio sp.]|uniref:Uncharacterized protein n=1 Tax=uncultured Desulfovibrio sp. TaxID=167968 RepID=A0A212L7B8_9BACT|nr:hypothetical protein KL86DES1_21307 [uncultured Desulfovibrio sp.]VZH34203.1 conserved protein of unknown function [Desulfovibrio sp. 86]